MVLRDVANWIKRKFFDYDKDRRNKALLKARAEISELQRENELLRNKLATCEQKNKELQQELDLITNNSQIDMELFISFNRKSQDSSKEYSVPHYFVLTGVVAGQEALEEAKRKYQTSEGIRELLEQSGFQNVTKGIRIDSPVVSDSSRSTSSSPSSLLYVDYAVEKNIPVNPTASSIKQKGKQSKINNQFS